MLKYVIRMTGSGKEAKMLILAGWLWKEVVLCKARSRVSSVVL